MYDITQKNVLALVKGGKFQRAISTRTHVAKDSNSFVFLESLPSNNNDAKSAAMSLFANKNISNVLTWSWQRNAQLTSVCQSNALTRPV